MGKSYLLFLFIIIASLFSCDTTSELNEMVDGYLTLETAFVYPENVRNNYSIVCNGDTLTGARYLVSRTNPSVTLEVFEKGKTEPELSQDLTLTESTTSLQFIKLQGQPLAIYEADKYTTIKINIIYKEGEDARLYKVLFNGGEVSVNSQVVNYVRTDQLTGTLEIQKEGQEVYSQEETFQPKGALSYMQLSEAEYLKVTEEEVPEPEKEQTWARFFYFAEDVGGATELELTLYLMSRNRDVFEKIETLTLTPGEISHYVLCDCSKPLAGDRVRSVVYDLRDPSKEGLIVDHTLQNGDISSISRGTNFRFATAQIKNGGTFIDVPIGVRW